MAAAPDNPALHEIDGVRIFAAGRARGDEWTESEIDAIVRNGNANFDLLKPTVVVGHEEAQPLTDKLPATHKQNSGEPAFGVVTNLRKEFALANGERVPFLVAKFRDVPGWLAGLIKGKAYRTVSAEIYPKPPEGVTNAEGPMLRRVALLGGEMPQIKTLGDLPLPEYQRYAELKFANVPTNAPAANITFRNAHKRADGIVLLFSEVTAMAAYKFVKGNLKKFADLKPASKTTLKKFDDVPTEGAPPPASRDELLALVADAGIDPAVAEKLDDAALAEFVRVFQAMSQAQAAVPNAEPAPAIAPSPTILPNPAPSPTPAPIPSQQPTSVTLKYGERTVTPEQFAELVRAENADAIKQIAEFKANTKREGLRQFCEPFVKSGHLTPAERDIQIELAMTLDDGVKKFGEGSTLTALDLWRKQIERLPVQFNFSERFKQPKATAGSDTIATVKRYCETLGESAAAKRILTNAEAIVKAKPDATPVECGVPAAFAA